MPIQPVDHAVDRAAVLHDRSPDTTTVEKMSPAAMTSEPRKPHQAVAVGVRGRLMNQLDALAVEEVTQLHRVGVVGVGRLRVGRRLLFASLGLDQPLQHVLVRENRRAFTGIGDIARDVAAGERRARRRGSFRCRRRGQDRRSC